MVETDTEAIFIDHSGPPTTYVKKKVVPQLVWLIQQIMQYIQEVVKNKEHRVGQDLVFLPDIRSDNPACHIGYCRIIRNILPDYSGTFCLNPALLDIRPNLSFVKNKSSNPLRYVALLKK